MRGPMVIPLLLLGSPMPAENITILCVDDEDIPRTLRRMVLQKKGYNVLTASSGSEALKCLRERAVDLVLSDQMMPGMTGTELTKAVKTECPEMPVILISGVNEIPLDAKYADCFVSKVGGPELLFQSLSDVLKIYGHVLA
jgi:CheY-like chemotaxis protein